MLENKKTRNGIHYTRYIMSWINSGGAKFGFGFKFEAWLRSEGLTEDEIHDIKEMAMCGKLELEINAEAFIKG